MIKVLQENINALRNAETRREYIEACENILDIYNSVETPEDIDAGCVFDELNIVDVNYYLDYLLSKYQKLSYTMTPGQVRDLIDILEYIDTSDKYCIVIDSPYEEVYGFSAKEKAADHLQAWLDDYKNYMEHKWD